MRMVHCGYYVREQDDADTIRTVDQDLDIATGDRLLATNYVYQDCKDLYSNHFITVLAVCSLVFLIFTSAMGCEQMEAIETGKGKIARMKQSVNASGSTEFNTVTTEFNEMFGGDSPNATWHWYLPCEIPFPSGMKKVVLGYEFNETCRPVPYQEGDEHKEQDALLENAENGQPSPPASPEDTGKTKTTRSLYSGQRVEPLPLSRRSNSRSSSHDDSDDGITLVDRTKARMV